MALKSQASRAPAAKPVPQPHPIAVRPSGAVALPADLVEELASHAKAAAAVERPSVSKISLKGGMMTYMGSQMAGDTMDVVIMAAVARNAYYKDPYRDDVFVNPTCFAILPVGEEMVPHENVTNPQHPTCEGCPKSAWGSEEHKKGSRGKACKEGRRLVVMPADALNDADTVKRGELAIIDVPVTSVNGYSNFVNALNATVQRPAWACITNLSIERDPKVQFRLVCTPIETIDDANILRAIKGRLDDAMRIAMIPHDEATIAPENNVPKPPPEKAQALRSKFAGARK